MAELFGMAEREQVVWYKRIYQLEGREQCNFGYILRRQGEILMNAILNTVAEYILIIIDRQE